MNNLTLFNYGKNQVRVVEIDGNPWFVAKDIAEILEISNHRDTVNSFPVSEKGAVGLTDTIGRQQKTTILSEAGLYRMIFQSRKESSEKFKTWVFSEVLPSIRKTGSYSNSVHLESMLIMGETLREFKKQIKEKDSQIEFLTPKAESWNSFLNSKGLISFHRAASILCIKGMGPQNLYGFAVRNGILKNSKTPLWEYVEKGYLVVRPNGNFDEKRKIKEHSEVFFTPRGLEFLQRKLESLGFKTNSTWSKETTKNLPGKKK